MVKPIIYNFGAGPAVLPEIVHQQIKEEWSNWRNLSIPLVEVSHRSEAFMQFLLQVENDLRELMVIPENYKVLFLPGGAQTQFSLVPMNLLGKNKAADYLVYGHWAHRAMDEAKRYGKINEIQVRSQEAPYSLLPEQQWVLNPHAAYFHYCSNETIEGIALPFIPKVSIPLVADMSSDILSKPIDVARYGLIYACTQKNLGVAGLAIVIMREDLLDQAMELTPSVLNYQQQHEAKSLYNTINTFACYVTGLMLQWLRQQGGVDAIAAINQRKAKKLYECIDQSHFYINKVAPAYRSMMNVTFNLPTKELEGQFLKQAEEAGLLNLRGHKISGGIRASIYNAMPEQGVDRLIEFMQAFKR